MIALATAATVIASQAVITGAFSISRQAMQLGYILRMAMRHTSTETIRQIYIPGINWMLAVLVIALVLAFGSSTALASAFGISGRVDWRRLVLGMVWSISDNIGGERFLKKK